MKSRRQIQQVGAQVLLPMAFPSRGKELGGEESNCRPFIKWAGGKSQLLPELIKRFPKKYGTYFEPFIGGGALFFAVQPSKAMLFDINAELIDTYKTVRSNVNALIKDLRKHTYSSDYYYALRSADRKGSFKRWSAVRRASRLIYLNKTCYNGLYRVNSDGEFNVPFGRYEHPKILDRENLLACSRALKRAKLTRASFEKIEKLVKKGDFVYFDPPFVPLSKTANFTSYTDQGFDEAMQLKLAALCKRLDKRGVKFMLSNSPTDLIREAYKSFNFETILASRAINSKGEKRGKIEEAIVRNYS